MNVYDACEQSFRRGYEQGKKDAMKHSYWVKRDGAQTCARCGGTVCQDEGLTLNICNYDYCPACGSKMDEDQAPLTYKNGKHGHWIISSDGYYPYCSECNQEPQSGIMTNWCPNCGAIMDEVD